MSDLELRYYFDPLCGWCYASAEALTVLAEQHGAQLRMMPTGLFFDARPVAAIADHAWRNDQRIGQLTGQRFSDAYHRDVLGNPAGTFSSKDLTTALVALGEIDPALEARFLHATQIARYVEGRDTSRADEVVRIAEAVASEAGVAFDADAFADRLQNDPALAERVEIRMAAARAEMNLLRASGVPTMAVRVGDATHVLGGQALYAGRDAVLAAMERLSPAA